MKNTERPSIFLTFNLNICNNKHSYNNQCWLDHWLRRTQIQQVMFAKIIHSHLHSNYHHVAFLYLV